VVDLISYDGVTAEDQFADRELYSMVRDKLAEFGADLDGREKDIFDERLMSEDPVTLQELGGRYGVSRERVRQVEEALKRKLREYLVEEIRIVPEEVVD
jgi:RNA polymerase sigma-32 factor